MINEKFKSISLIKKAIQNKEVSVKELVELKIKEIENDPFNSFVLVDSKNALKKAEISQDKILKKSGGLLEGIPYGIKDLFCTKGIKTTCCSKMLENFIPEFDAEVVENIDNEGGISLGKLNMDEFAMGVANLYSSFGPSINPNKDATDPSKLIVPGGSSGGSAACVRAGYVPFSLGSDTGGSVRNPASFCGIFGFKPSYGICSRYGMIPFANSLDTPGILSNSVEDARLVMDIMSSKSEKDTHVQKREDVKLLFSKKINYPMQKGTKICFQSLDSMKSLHPSVLKSFNECIQNLKEMGCIVEEVDIEEISVSTNAYYIISTVEAFSNLSKYNGIYFGSNADHYLEENSDSIFDQVSKFRSEKFGREVIKRICTGAAITSGSEGFKIRDYAAKIRYEVIKRYKDVFSKYYALIMPTFFDLPFSVNDLNSFSQKTKAYDADSLTTHVNLAGAPSSSVSCGFDDKTKLPIGIQVISGYMQDHNVLHTSYNIDKAFSG